MEEDERQFNRGHPAEDREIWPMKNDRRETENVAKRDITKTRPWTAHESSSRTPDISSHHPDEEGSETSIYQPRPDIRVTVTSKGNREVMVSENEVIPSISTRPAAVTLVIPLPMWTSLSHYEGNLRSTRESLQSTIQTIHSEHGRLLREMRQRTLDAMTTMNNISTKEEFP